MGRLGIAHRAVEDMVIISFLICSRYKPVHATVMAPKNFSTKNKAKPQRPDVNKLESTERGKRQAAPNPGEVMGV